MLRLLIIEDEALIAEDIKDICQLILDGKINLIEGAHLIVQKAYELPDEKFTVNEHLFKVFI
ncbi:MAG TPA: hypothetical protein PKD57_13910, partial [Saprospiraceae bacterium]|nr:hypothetical protein [Saprospiraceae bacterium]